MDKETDKKKEKPGTQTFHKQQKRLFYVFENLVRVYLWFVVSTGRTTFSHKKHFHNDYLLFDHDAFYNRPPHQATPRRCRCAFPYR
jgi:hypothetical protein